MNTKLKSANRILILGDAGRGKSTLAKKLSEQLHIPAYSTDDFFWKKKFTEKQDKEKSIAEIKTAYAKDKWIIEGTTQHLVEPGFEKADLILYLTFPHILTQWWVLIKRYRTREEEKFSDLLVLLRHVLYKRYSLGYKKGEPTLMDTLKPYKDKVVVLHSYKEIDECMVDDI